MGKVELKTGQKRPLASYVRIMEKESMNEIEFQKMAELLKLLLNIQCFVRSK